MKRALSFFAFAFLVACASDEASYCDNVGNCTQAGDTTWIQSCNDELATLSTEAVASGCTPELDAYFACTSAHFDCEGITATFPTCDAAHAALDACIANAQVGTACAALAAATASCATNPPPPPACSASRDCQARCYLQNVANPCAPRVDELANVTSCGSACPQ